MEGGERGEKNWDNCNRIINKIYFKKNGKAKEKISETKNYFFEKINEICKYLETLTKGKKGTTYQNQK